MKSNIIVFCAQHNSESKSVHGYRDRAGALIFSNLNGPDLENPLHR